MTRKDYIAVARILDAQRRRTRFDKWTTDGEKLHVYAVLNSTVKDLCLLYASNNPGFSPEKFCTASGITDPCCIARIAGTIEGSQS